MSEIGYFYVNCDRVEIGYRKRRRSEDLGGDEVEVQQICQRRTMCR